MFVFLVAVESWQTGIKGLEAGICHPNPSLPTRGGSSAAPLAYRREDLEHQAFFDISKRGKGLHHV